MGPSSPGQALCLLGGSGNKGIYIYIYIIGKNGKEHGDYYIIVGYTGVLVGNRENNIQRLYGDHFSLIPY